MGNIHEAINKLAKGNFNQWHKLLPIVEFNLRTAPHSTTGITPAMALYGRELKKGILEVPVINESALDERRYGEKRKAAQKAMHAISSMIAPDRKPRGPMKGKTFLEGQVVRIHRDPPPKMRYISKWRNPYEEKGEVTEVLENNHYRIKSLKTGKVTREHASRLNTCLYLSDINAC